MPYTSEPELRDVTLRLAEVLTLVERQFTQAEIADHLHVAVSTIHTHVAHLEAFFGCHSMAELGRCWTSREWDWLLLMARSAGLDRNLRSKLEGSNLRRRVEKNLTPPEDETKVTKRDDTRAIPRMDICLQEVQQCQLERPNATGGLLRLAVSSLSWRPPFRQPSARPPKHTPERPERCAGPSISIQRLSTSGSTTLAEPITTDGSSLARPTTTNSASGLAIGSRGRDGSRPREIGRVHVLQASMLAVAILVVAVACGGSSDTAPGNPDVDTLRDARWQTLMESDAWRETNGLYLSCMEAKGFHYLGDSETDGVVLLDGSLFKPSIGDGGHNLRGAYLDFRIATEACSASSGVDALRAQHDLANPTVNPNRLKAVNDYSIQQMACLAKRGWSIAEPKVSMGLVVFELPASSEEEQQAFERDRIQCNIELYGSPGGPAIP